MKKLKFITIFLIVHAFALTTSAQQTVQYDILLKGGHVIDPANNVNTVCDVAVANGVIASVEKNIPSASARKVVDVSGYIVSPGFVDLHTHIFYTFRTQRRWVIPDHHSFQSGVTTMVDGGTSGADNFEDFKKVIDTSRTRILVFLNIAAPGKNESQNDPLQFKVDLAVKTAKKYPDIIVGFKSCDYWSGGNPYDEIHTPWASVDSALAAGRRAELPIMVSFGPRPPQGNSPGDAGMQDQADILTCMLSRAIPVVLDDGKLNPDIIKAQKRGVLFDGTHGAGSFTYRNAVPAIQQGFRPNSISTDLHGPGRTSAVVDLLNVMSKFLSMGMTIEEVIKCSTINPARIVNHPELGSLTIGSTADIAVTELLNGKFSYVDTNGGKIRGDKKLQIIATLFGGDIVFDPYGVSCPEWESIPKNSSYWETPSGQKW